MRKVYLSLYTELRVIPQLEEDLYFSLIGRKKLFTAGRVGSLLPPGKLAQNTGSAVKKRRNIDDGYKERKIT